MGSPEGFTYTVRKDGDVEIRHHGRLAATVRGERATAFLADAGGADDLELMARLTGNYRRGNERTSADHARHGRT